MRLIPRHWQTRETRFVGTLALSLVLIAVYLDQSQGEASRQGAGYRVIDLATLKRRIDAGELREREAQWYRPSRADERPDSGREAKP